MGKILGDGVPTEPLELGHDEDKLLRWWTYDGETAEQLREEYELRLKRATDEIYSKG